MMIDIETGRQFDQIRASGLVISHLIDLHSRHNKTSRNIFTFTPVRFTL